MAQPQFPVVRRGYEPKAVDTVLEDLRDRIAHAEVVNDFRRRKASSASIDNAGEEVLADVDAGEIRFDNAELVHVAIEHLSIEHRRVLVLFFLEEMSIEEIAGVLDSPPGTIKSRLHYAKAALKRQIEELGR